MLQLFARFLNANDLLFVFAGRAKELPGPRSDDQTAAEPARCHLREQGQKGEIAKLKAAQEAVVAERDTLLQKVDRVDEDKQRAMKSTKARYLAELRKLRDAHKEEKDKAVDEAEDRGYK